MPTYDHKLASPPTDARGRELWLQHAAGFILFQDARQYAIDRIDPKLSPDARAAALKGIDDAVYGLMMVIDGVTGALRNDQLAVALKVAVQLLERGPSSDETVVTEVDLAHGDGMCMGYHGWLEGDFGKDPLVVK